MVLLVREALRRLCAEIGWSYAVFWSTICCGNSRHLVWTDGHHEQQPRASAAADVSVLEQAGPLLNKCDLSRATDDNVDPLAGLAFQAEDRVVNLFTKMRSQVHVLGDGLLGRAALTGNHQWIYQSREGYVSECLDEMNHQFSAGMKTIAIVPVLPFGVVQLGSIQMIKENMAFIQHVRHQFLQLGCIPGALLSDGSLKDIALKEMSIDLPTSFYESGTTSSNLSNLRSFSREDVLPQINKPHMTNSLTDSCISGKLLFDNTLLSSKPAAVVGGVSTLNCSIETVSPSTICHNGQLGGQAVFSVDDGQSHQTQMHQSSYGSLYQQSLIGSNVLGSTVPYFQGQNLSDIRKQRLLNNASSDSTSQLLPCEKTFSGSLKDSRLLTGQDESSNNRNHFGKENLLPCNTEKDIIGTKKANAYPIAGVQVVSSASHAGGYSAAPDDSQRNTHTHSISTLITSDIGNELFHELETSNDPKPSSIYCQPSTFSPQDYWVNTSSIVQGTQRNGNYFSVGSSGCASNGQKNNGDKKSQNISCEFTLDECIAHVSGDDLFDVLGIDFKAKHCSGSLGGFSEKDVFSTGKSGADLSACVSQLEDPVFDAMPDEFSSCGGVFIETGPDQLLDAMISQITSGCNKKIDTDLYCKAPVTEANSSVLHVHGENSGPSPPVVKAEAASSSSKSTGSASKMGEPSQKDASFRSQLSLWMENGQNMKIESMMSAQCKRMDEIGKSNRKRPRPGESPRPRPKDRQMIQDRVKELREIVPLGAKCSIDALLERTIKHMLFLQSVTKHADKLKETGEPKIISKEGGLLLKDNFEGGATWAFEVGTQSMVCPIIVEDLKPPRQLLVEMLCEERGFFLEIADLIKGLGLTILKGVMEARNDKVWARFAVEANRDVTRMDIFMSLVRLLEPNAGSGVTAQGFDGSNVPCNMVCQSVPATGSVNILQ